MEQDRNKISAINFGLRYFAAAMVVSHSLPSLFAFLGFDYIKGFILNVLPGMPMPILTQWVLGAYQFSFVIPLIAVLVSVGFLTTSKSRQMPYYVAAACMICLALHTLAVYAGLLLPLLQIFPVLL